MDKMNDECIDFIFTPLPPTSIHSQQIDCMILRTGIFILFPLYP